MEAQGRIEQEDFEKLKAETSKVAILRSNLFAHRSASLSYSDVFKKANVTPNQLRDLTDTLLSAANCLLIARGLNIHVFNRLPVMQAEAIIGSLSRYRPGKG